MDDFRVTQWTEAQRVEIVSSIDPVSLQNTDGRKQAFKTALGEAIEAATDHIFVDDVEIGVEWFISPQRRYETNKVADLDNTLKSILDGLQGPTGLLIDDNQVQSIKASWLDPSPNYPDMKLRVQVTSLMIDLFWRRDTLAFVSCSQSRCFPYSDIGAAGVVFREVLKESWSTYNKLLDLGADSTTAASILPIVRSYPVSKLGAFRVEPLNS